MIIDDERLKIFSETFLLGERGDGPVRSAAPYWLDPSALLNALGQFLTHFHRNLRLTTSAPQTFASSSSE